MSKEESFFGNITGVGEDTGEIKEFILVPLKKQYNTMRGGYFLAIQEGFLHLATLNLQGKDMKVLMYVMGKLDFENYICITQKDIGEALNMKQTNVSRALKTLVEYGVIHKGPKVGTTYTYRLDPSFGFKGKPKNIKKLESSIKRAKLQGLTVISNNKNRENKNND